MMLPGNTGSCASVNVTVIAITDVGPTQPSYTLHTGFPICKLLYSSLFFSMHVLLVVFTMTFM